jgi:hypothetical protein
MRRWMAAPLVLVPAVWLTTLGVPSALAQPPEPIKETFRTPDGVELHGLFHAAQKNPATAPVVVFLYAPGADRDMTKGDWAGLAKKLTEAPEGYHVFQFDWRGHGKSAVIKDTKKFWTNPYLNGPQSNFNVFIKGGPPKMPLKNDLSVKDLGANAAKYMPAYLNDLAGVRLYLDTKNDNKELNASSIYIVGTGDAAGLGMAWLAAEWKRPAVMPGVNQLGLGVAGIRVRPAAVARRVRRGRCRLRRRRLADRDPPHLDARPDDSEVGLEQGYRAADPRQQPDAVPLRREGHDR